VAPRANDEISGAAAERPRAAVIFNPTKSGIDVLRAAVARAEALQEFAPSLGI
jgi:diacylglycerol kinase (ATP)